MYRRPDYRMFSAIVYCGVTISTHIVHNCMIKWLKCWIFAYIGTDASHLQQQVSSLHAQCNITSRQGSKNQTTHNRDCFYLYSHDCCSRLTFPVNSENYLVPIYMRLGRPQKRSGRTKKKNPASARTEPGPLLSSDYRTLTLCHRDNINWLFNLNINK